MNIFLRVLFLLLFSYSYSQVSNNIPNCIDNLDEYYFYQEFISEDEASNLNLSSNVQSRLREELTKQIANLDNSTRQILKVQMAKYNMNASNLFEIRQILSLSERDPF